MSVTPEFTCPKCGFVMDHASHMGEGELQPSADDVSVCMGCAAVLRFTDDVGTQQALTVEELRELESDKDVWRQVQKVRTAIICTNIVKGPPRGKKRG